MLHRCLRIAFVQSLVLFTQKRVHFPYSTIQTNKMEAIKTIKELGYGFNGDGELRQLNENGDLGDEPFQFNISDDHQECQANYEKIGRAVTQYVYNLLETQEHLIRLPVPKYEAPESTMPKTEYVAKDTELDSAAKDSTPESMVQDTAQDSVAKDSIPDSEASKIIQDSAHKDTSPEPVTKDIELESVGKDTTQDSAPKDAAPESMVHDKTTETVAKETAPEPMVQDTKLQTPVHKYEAQDFVDKTFIFASQDYDKKDTLLVLIHGSGVVRAGQWARSIIINQSLDKGTQIPYIKKAIAKGYGVLVMNTNDNFTEDGNEIRGSETPERHGVYVWRNYISNANADNILIVAHSYGGVVTVDLAYKMEDFENKVTAIAFTDSVHGYSRNRVTSFLRETAKNWVTSSEPLDTPIRGPRSDVPRVSAGHTQHEMTSYSCMDSVFKFFDEKLIKEVPESTSKI